MRIPNVPPPDRLGRVDGLAYALHLPEGESRGGVVILHGAGSSKESHLDFARLCAAHGMAAVAFDQRGHGESDGPMDARAAADVAAVAGVLPPGPVALRGSSMGGYLALVAADGADAAAVVAICPASADGLARGIRAGRFDFAADVEATTAFLAEHPVDEAAARLTCPLLLLHAEGDETVPVAHSRELHARAPGSRLVVAPGGNHRSVQHDPELQAASIRFLRQAFAAAK
jgi:pimeloyl-ACP methyl ester carboxylesterase